MPQRPRGVIRRDGREALAVRQLAFENSAEIAVIADDVPVLARRRHNGTPERAPPGYNRGS